MLSGQKTPDGVTVVADLVVFKSTSMTGIMAGGYSNEFGGVTAPITSQFYPWIARFKI